MTNTAAAPASRNGKPRLEPTAFLTSRVMDFFTRDELVKQTGHQVADWPLVNLKELLDNAIDACEDADIAPEIAVRVDAGGITVADNGSGIPAKTVEGVLDFTVRVSSREAYVSPTRGKQGNALKTLVAMPYVLDGKQGRVDITAGGTRHEIMLGVDRIREELAIRHDKAKANGKTGTSVRVYWPKCACTLLRNAEARFLQIASDYTFLNPHLTLTVDWFGKTTRVEATNRGWSKWLPCRPTSCHWYTVENFKRLVAAYIKDDMDRGTDRTVRAFLGLFDGLSGSAKQKRVLDATGLARVNLSALRSGDDLNSGLVAQLLAAMKAMTKAVKPKALGMIGRAHLEARFQALDCEMESFAYRPKADLDLPGLPFLAEVAFAWCPEARERRVIIGVNWSPAIRNPFRQLHRFAYGSSLDSILERLYIRQTMPVVCLVHLACPRVEYTDRGKSALALGDQASWSTDEEE